MLTIFPLSYHLQESRNFEVILRPMMTSIGCIVFSGLGLNNLTQETQQISFTLAKYARNANPSILLKHAVSQVQSTSSVIPPLVKSMYVAT